MERKDMRRERKKKGRNGKRGRGRQKDDREEGSWCGVGKGKEGRERGWIKRRKRKEREGDK